MFKRINFEVIDSSLKKHFKEHYSAKTESLRQFLLESPTQYSDVFQFFDLTRIFLGIRHKRKQIGLAIISWYFPEEIRFLVQMELRETWDPESQEIREILLTSKDLAIAWLLCESEWNESDFFGNVLNEDLARQFSECDFAKVSRSYVERYTGYCRGYQESNRGAPSTLTSEHLAELTVEEDLLRKMKFELKVQELFQKTRQDFYNYQFLEVLSGQLNSIYCIQ